MSEKSCTRRGKFFQERTPPYTIPYNVFSSASSTMVLSSTGTVACANQRPPMNHKSFNTALCPQCRTFSDSSLPLPVCANEVDILRPLQDSLLDVTGILTAIYDRQNLPNEASDSRSGQQLRLKEVTVNRQNNSNNQLPHNGRFNGYPFNTADVCVGQLNRGVVGGGQPHQGAVARGQPYGIVTGGGPSCGGVSAGGQPYGGVAGGRQSYGGVAGGGQLYNGVSSGRQLCGGVGGGQPYGGETGGGQTYDNVFSESNGGQPCGCVAGGHQPYGVLADEGHPYRGVAGGDQPYGAVAGRGQLYRGVAGRGQLYRGVAGGGLHNVHVADGEQSYESVANGGEPCVDKPYGSVAGIGLPYGGVDDTGVPYEDVAGASNSFSGPPQSDLSNSDELDGQEVDYGCDGVPYCGGQQYVDNVGEFGGPSTMSSREYNFRGSFEAGFGGSWRATAGKDYTESTYGDPLLYQTIVPTQMVSNTRTKVVVPQVHCNEFRQHHFTELPSHTTLCDIDWSCDPYRESTCTPQLQDPSSHTECNCIAVTTDCTYMCDSNETYTDKLVTGHSRPRADAVASCHGNLQPESTTSLNCVCVPRPDLTQTAKQLDDDDWDLRYCSFPDGVSLEEYLKSPPTAIEFEQTTDNNDPPLEMPVSCSEQVGEVCGATDDNSDYSQDCSSMPLCRSSIPRIELDTPVNDSIYENTSHGCKQPVPQGCGHLDSPMEVQSEPDWQKRQNQYPGQRHNFIADSLEMMQAIAKGSRSSNSPNAISHAPPAFLKVKTGATSNMPFKPLEMTSTSNNLEVDDPAEDRDLTSICSQISSLPLPRAEHSLTPSPANQHHASSPRTIKNVNVAVGSHNIQSPVSSTSTQVATRDATSCDATNQCPLSASQPSLTGPSSPPGTIKNLNIAVGSHNVQSPVSSTSTQDASKDATLCESTNQGPLSASQPSLTGPFEVADLFQTDTCRIADSLVFKIAMKRDVSIPQQELACKVVSFLSEMFHSCEKSFDQRQTLMNLDISITRSANLCNTTFDDSSRMAIEMCMPSQCVSLIEWMSAEGTDKEKLLQRQLVVQQVFILMAAIHSSVDKLSLWGSFGVYVDRRNNQVYLKIEFLQMLNTMQHVQCNGQYNPRVEDVKALRQLFTVAMQPFLSVDSLVSPALRTRFHVTEVLLSDPDCVSRVVDLCRVFGARRFCLLSVDVKGDKHFVFCEEYESFVVAVRDIMSKLPVVKSWTWYLYLVARNSPVSVMDVAHADCPMIHLKFMCVASKVKRKRLKGKVR